MNMNGSKWVLGTLLSLALIAGSAHAATASEDISCSNNFSVTAVVTPGIGTVAAIDVNDKDGMGQTTIVFSVGFNPNTNGIHVGGSMIGMYEPTTSYEVEIVAETINGVRYMTTTVKLASSGEVVCSDSGRVCEGDVDEASASAETVTSLTTG